MLGVGGGVGGGDCTRCFAFGVLLLPAPGAKLEYLDFGQIDRPGSLIFNSGS